MVRFAWIESRRADLLWYIGPPLLGLACVPAALALDRWLQPRATARGPGAALIVVSIWSLLLDGPHFWSTIARTVIDPAEWRRRGGILARSFAFFLLAPAIVVTPWALGALAARFGAHPPASLESLGPSLLLVAFLSWAYFHTVRQHWGFFRLYARKAGELEAADELADRIAFHALLFLPPFLFLSSAWYPGRGALLPSSAILAPGGAADRARSAVHAGLWTAYAATALGYLAWQLRAARRGRVVGGSKLLLLASVAPVHLAPFVHPALPVFTPAIVGIGHGIQYQRIVWRYGRAHYGTMGDGAAPAPRRVFGNAAVYLLLGWTFTFALLRGPWVARLAAGIASVAGLVVHGVPTPLLNAAASALFTGWLFQHYYLDARIWRLSRDGEVRRGLGV